MPTDAEIDAALDAVFVAARRHRALLRAGDRASEHDVWRAYVALNNATVRYDDLLSEAYDEVTPWDVEYLETDESGDAGVAELPAPNGVAPAYAPVGAAAAADGSATVCVRQRRDFQVPDIGALIRLGSETRRQNWAAHDEQYGRTPVDNLGEAVYELVLAGDGSLAALDAYPELVPGNGVLLVNAVERPLVFTEAAEGEEDEPFRLTPADVLLYRLDEEVIEEADADGDAAPRARAGSRPGADTEPDGVRR